MNTSKSGYTAGIRKLTNDSWFKDVIIAPGGRTRQFRKWMFKDLDDNEILTWLREFKSSHPVMFQKLLVQALSELPSERWNLIKWNLAETDHPIL